MFSMLGEHHGLGISKATFFPYEIYLYSSPKTQHFSLYCNCRDLKIRIQIRLPLTNVPPHTSYSMDIIIKEQNKYPTTSFLMTFVLQLKSPVSYSHCLQRSTYTKVFWKQVLCFHFKNQLLSYTLKVSQSRLIEHKKKDIQIVSLRQD